MFSFLCPSLRNDDKWSWNHGKTFNCSQANVIFTSDNSIAMMIGWGRAEVGLALLDTKSKLHQLAAKNICLFLLSLALKVSSELWSLFAAKGAANLVVKAKHIDPVDVPSPPVLV